MDNKLAVVVGHSEEYWGTTAVEPLLRREFAWNKDVAQIIEKYAKEIGLDCRVFEIIGHKIEDTYRDVGLWSHGANAVCIELHFNSCRIEEKGLARGTETLFDSHPADSITFAREIQEAMIKVFGRSYRQNRGLKRRDDDRGSRNLKLMKLTGCLVEPFFGDNKLECQLAMDKMFDYAKALATTSLKFLQQKKCENKMELH